MIIDANYFFSDAQAVTEDADSTNTLDMHTSDIGDGTPIWAIIQVGTAFDSSGDSTSLQVQLKECATEGGTYKECGRSRDIEEATLVSGYQFGIWIPTDAKQYLKLYFDVGSEENFTAGTVDAFLSTHPPKEN